LPFLIGAGLALAAFVLGRVVGLDRERAFYTTALIVIAALYDLFAVMGGSTQALILESLVGTVFLAAALMGFRRNLWIVAAGLLGHGVMDFFHGHLISNPGVPRFWPMFCGAYDVVAAGCLAWLLLRSQVPARRTPEPTA
jgi:hypothetical protein